MDDDDKCYDCDASGRKYCDSCNGTGIDATPCGTGGDHCPWCGADWKRPHDESCSRAR